MRAAGAVAVAALALSAAASHAGNGRVLQINGSAVIAASGNRVAIHVYGANCGEGIVWAPRTDSATRLKDPCASDAAFSNLTLAGDTALWWDYSTGNHVYCDDVYANGKALGLCDGTQGDTYYEFAGDNTFAAIADFSLCEADCTDANGNLLPDGAYGVEVRRLKAGQVVPILKPLNFRTFLDARNWRVATIEPKATLTMYDAAGKKLWSRSGITGVIAGRIDGSTIVLQQGRSLRAYSSTGAGIARHLPRGARLDGAVGGLVVYRSGSTVHVLRLSDGRDRGLVTTAGLNSAQVTSAGVFYSVGPNVNSGVRGVVTFVPIADVLRKLR